MDKLNGFFRALRSFRQKRGQLCAWLALAVCGLLLLSRRHPLGIANRVQTRPGRESRTCQPRSSVLFLKTRKTGSSALQNVLMRYGWSRNLSFVLPYDGNMLAHPFPFTADVVGQMQNRSKFDFLCHHAIYSRQKMCSLLPADAVKVTILREVVPQAESMIHYSRSLKTMGLSSIHEFLEDPYTIYQQFPQRQRDLRNPTLFDFGLGYSQMDDQLAINKIVQKIERDFDLVLIKEHFYESLVLLREYMCWSWQDVVVLDVNSFRGTRQRAQISADDVIRLREWNRGDVMLYRRALANFKLLVQNYGVRKMEKDVSHLKTLTARWKTECVEREVRNAEINDTDIKAWHVGTYAYVLRATKRSNRTCQALVMSEDGFTARLQDRQFGAGRPRNPPEVLD